MNPVRNVVRAGHMLSARPILRSPALPVLTVAARRGYHEKDKFGSPQMLYSTLVRSKADQLKLLDHYTNPRNGS